MVTLGLLGVIMVKNILEDIVYIEPRTDLPVPEGMCTQCSVDDPTDPVPDINIDTPEE